MTPQQLRNSILQMAIKGKLTEQRAEDGNAADLLKEIKAEKVKLIAEKKIKKEKPLPEISEDEIPFEIPDNWMWCRLGEIFIKDIGGGTPSKDNSKFWNGTIPWMSVKDFSHAKNNVVEDTIDHITIEGVENSATNIIDTSAIILCVRMGLGRYAKITQPTAINQDLRAFWLSNSILEQYFFKFYSAINISGTGTTVKGIKRNELLELLFPLPPLAEQKRIVARLEEILPQVDAYEKAYDELQVLNKQFPGNLKNSLLQMAVEGKLVEQRVEEGNAADLLKEIQAEKAKLIAEKKIKKEKPLPEISEDEIPFEIPENWVWCRLGNISSWSSGATPSKSNPDYYGGDIPWLLTGDLNNGYINAVDGRITELALEETSVKLNPAGSILIAMYGATIGKLGILNFPCTTNQACCAYYPMSSLYNMYIFYFLMSQKKEFMKKSEGGAQPNISKEKIVNTIIPLPPLVEQKRIVTKLEQLLPLCDALQEY